MIIITDSKIGERYTLTQWIYILRNKEGNLRLNKRLK